MFDTISVLLLVAAIPFVAAAILLPLLVFALPALAVAGGTSDPGPRQPGPAHRALDCAPKVRAFRQILRRGEQGCHCNPDVELLCTGDIGCALGKSPRSVEDWLAAFHRSGLLEHESRGGDQVTCRPGPDFDKWVDMTS